jgi:hypothetical protein
VNHRVGSIFVAYFITRIRARPCRETPKITSCDQREPASIEQSTVGPRRTTQISRTPAVAENVIGAEISSGHEREERDAGSSIANHCIKGELSHVDYARSSIVKTKKGHSAVSYRVAPKDNLNAVNAYSSGYGIVQKTNVPASQADSSFGSDRGISRKIETIDTSDRADIAPKTASSIVHGLSTP